MRAHGPLSRPSRPAFGRCPTHRPVPATALGLRAWWLLHCTADRSANGDVCHETQPFIRVVDAPGTRRNRRQHRARLVFEPLEQRLLLAQVSWNVDADGLWNVASNWGMIRVSAEFRLRHDDVVIDRPAGDFTVTYAKGPAPFAASPRASGWSSGPDWRGTTALTVNGAVDATGGLTVAYATLAGATLSAGTTVQSDYGTLSGVTVNGTIDLSAPGGTGRHLTVTNGLTLNGTLLLGVARRHPDRRFCGTQTLGGTGTIRFGGTSTGSTPSLVTDYGGPLTIGPDLKIDGGGGTIGDWAARRQSRDHRHQRPGNGASTVASVDNRGRSGRKTGRRCPSPPWEREHRVDEPRRDRSGERHADARRPVPQPRPHRRPQLQRDLQRASSPWPTSATSAARAARWNCAGRSTTRTRPSASTRPPAPGGSTARSAAASSPSPARNSCRSANGNLYLDAVTVEGTIDLTQSGALRSSATA